MNLDGGVTYKYRIAQWNLEEFDKTKILCKNKQERPKYRTVHLENFLLNMEKYGCKQENYCEQN